MSEALAYHGEFAEPFPMNGVFDVATGQPAGEENVSLESSWILRVLREGNKQIVDYTHLQDGRPARYTDARFIAKPVLQIVRYQD